MANRAAAMLAASINFSRIDRDCMKFALLLPSCFCMLFSLTLFYFSFFFILVLSYSA